MFSFGKGDGDPKSLGPASNRLSYQTKQEKSTEEDTSTLRGHHGGSIRQAHTGCSHGHQCKKYHPSTHVLLLALRSQLDLRPIAALIYARVLPERILFLFGVSE